MTSLLSKIWFPAAIVGAVTLQMGAFSHNLPSADEGMEAAYYFDDPTDTVKYPRAGYRRYWTPEEQASTVTIADSLLALGAGGFGDEDEEGEGTMQRPVALDTIIAPDSLLQIDTFRYYYFAALSDSLCHMWVRDSLITALDTASYMKLDSLYAVDSIARIETAYWAWYATLDKKERKKADQERLLPIKKARADSIAKAKEDKKFIRDSIIENTPRILESFVLKDSLAYQRLVHWEHDRDFHDIKILPIEDTAFNYRFYDYPFQRQSSGATWLGVAGSPVQQFDFSKRGSSEGVGFYEPQESWSYNPSNLPKYNTKTPYTELAYWGTLLAGSSKESDNLHILSTQNITPAFNFTLLYDRFGGGGMMLHETTINKTASVHANYMGKKYMAHGGYIYNMVSREENGGVADLSMVRDTLVDMREAAVRLSSASSLIKKNTFFLDQQYRVPLYFVQDLFKGKKNVSDTLDASMPGAAPDESSQAASGEENAPEGEASAADSLSRDDDITTFFIGHSSEFSSYRRAYSDDVSRSKEGDFFSNTFYYHPTMTRDSLSVKKLENKVFVRLQPWSADAALSKLDVGVGHRLMRYYTFDPHYLSASPYYNRNAAYVYAGIDGHLFRALEWRAKGRYTFLGDEINDFSLGGDAVLTLHPFRRHRGSPLTIEGHFNTSLQEPEYYVRHIYTNHYKWDNDFGKISHTRAGGKIAIPHLGTSLEVNYHLLAGNIWYDSSSMPRQNTEAMSILTASLSNSLTLFKHIHADHRVLFQLSSNQEVVPLPMISGNGRYYVQFPVGPVGAMQMQIGADVWYFTEWNLPAWNPAIGVFYNQTGNSYGNAPYIDAFVNMQWQRTCIFVKWENVNMGWPLETHDYFSADRYIRTTRVFKFGIYWPFYTQPAKDKPGAQKKPES